MTPCHEKNTKTNADADWPPDRTTVFNIQILNSITYQAVTGEAPRRKTMNASIYAALGFLFFKMYEEPTGVHGDFSKVKSMAALSKDTQATVWLTNTPIRHPTRLIDPHGSLRPFRTVRDPMKEYSGYHVASF
jgi:hypothetical protein